MKAAGIVRPRRRRPSASRSSARAELEAGTIANSLCAGELDILTLTNADRMAYVRAMAMLQPTGTPLEMAVMQFVESVRLLGGASLLEAAKF